MRNSILIMLLLMLSGCINPYSYTPPTYLAQNSAGAESSVTYLKPVIEQNKVHPIKEIIIKGVEKGSSAEKAGLQIGDRIRTIDGKSFSTAEIYFEYLDRARLRKKTYKIVKSNNVERETVVEPESSDSYPGIANKFIDNEGNVFYPRIYYGDLIYQAGKNYSMTGTMGFDGALLVLAFQIDNLSDKDLDFDKSQIIFLDARNGIQPILTQAQVVTQHYSDAMARNPMAALQLAPTLMGAQNASNNSSIRIPQGANLSDKVYILGESVYLPITARIKIEEETFEFQFG